MSRLDCARDSFSSLMSGLALSLLCLACLPAAEGVWYANNGSRIYADQTVPTSWDAEAGTNIAWKAPLPNWSNGSPIIVGTKLLVCSEPTDYAPYLTCLDADSGEQLWQVELDPLAAMPADRQSELRTQTQRAWAWNRQMITLWNDVKQFADREKGALDPKSGKFKNGKPAGFDEQFGERLAELGLKFEGFKKGAGGFQTVFPFSAKDNDQAKLVQSVKDLGLAWEYWSYFGTWNGTTFGTPASDGERVFVATGQNLFACYDLDGKLLWQHRFDWPNRRKAKQQVPQQFHERVTDGKGKFAWPYNAQGWVATSPVYADGAFLSLTGAWIRCFEADSGKLRWSIPMRGGIGQNCCTPGVVALGGEYFLIAPGGEGRTGPNGDDIIRISDGSVCGILPGSSSSKMSIAGPVIEGDLVIGFAGDWRDRDVVAHRLSYDGQAKVTAEELWRIKQKSIRNLRLWRAALADGKLFSGSVVIDATNGKLLADKLPDARHNYCWWSGMIIGKHYLSIDHNAGTFVFRERLGTKKVGEATLPKNPPEARDEARILGEERGRNWAVLSAATPVAHRNRLYVRSYDYLWCIAE